MPIDLSSSHMQSVELYDLFDWILGEAICELEIIGGGNKELFFQDGHCDRGDCKRDKRYDVDASGDATNFMLNKKLNTDVKFVSNVVHATKLELYAKRDHTILQKTVEDAKQDAINFDKLYLEHANQRIMSTDLKNDMQNLVEQKAIHSISKIHNDYRDLEDNTLALTILKKRVLTQHQSSKMEQNKLKLDQNEKKFKNEISIMNNALYNEYVVHSHISDYYDIVFVDIKNQIKYWEKKRTIDFEAYTVKILQLQHEKEIVNDQILITQVLYDTRQRDMAYYLNHKIQERVLKDKIEAYERKQEIEHKWEELHEKCQTVLKESKRKRSKRPKHSK